MNHAFWEYVAETPWWVPVLTAYIVFIAWQATQPRIMPVKLLYVMPCYFIFLLVATAYYLIQLTWQINLALFFGTLLGLPLGAWQLKFLNIQLYADKRHLHFPGSWLLLGFIIAFMGLRLYFGAIIYDFLYNLITTPENHIWVMFLYGLYIGLFTGRIAYVRRLMRTGPFRELAS